MDLEKKYKELLELYKKGEPINDPKLKEERYDFQYKDLIPYPELNDPNFNKTLYAKKEFYRNKAMDSEEKDFDKVSAQKCSQTTFTVDKFQKIIKNFMSPLTPYNSLLVYASVGTGKCHGIDTPILMYDGSIKMIQDIIIGDVVMGDDSTPRNVLSLGQGDDDMYDIIDPYNNKYKVNSTHILCLINKEGVKINIELCDFLKFPMSEQKKWLGYRTMINMRYQLIKDDPYEIGYNIVDKIDDTYKINTYEIRLHVLAGILDKYATIESSAYIIPSNIAYKEDFFYLVRSLGFCIYNSQQYIYILGILSKIPTKTLLTTPEDTLNVLQYDIKIKYVDKNRYYGFTLDGNHKYVMGDFTVTHNTCSAISIAEQYHDIYKKNVLVILSSSLVDNFKKQIFDVTKYNIKKNEANLCMGTKYPDMVFDRHILTPEALEKRVNSIIKERYEFMGYQQLANIMDNLDKLVKEQQRDKDKRSLVYSEKVKEQFSDRLIIIDEAHNLRVPAEKGNKIISEAFLKMMKFVDNVKLVLLTATPMFNEATEIAWTMNLLLTNDKRPTLIKDDLFDKENNITTKGKKLLIESSRGYISFMRGENPFSFPFRLWPSINGDKKLIKTYPKKDIYGDSIKNPIKFLEIIESTMSEYQKKVYNIFKNKFTKEGELKEDDEEEGDITNNNDLKNTMQVSNIVYPYEGELKHKDNIKKTYGNTGFENCFKYENKKFVYKEEIKKKYGEFLSYEKIANYAPKIKTILDYVISSKGIVFIYSRYYGSGLIPLAIALEHIGLSKYSPSGNLMKDIKVDNKFDKKFKYIMLSRQQRFSPNNDKEIADAKMNDNLEGEKIKVVIVSKIGTEGIDFKRIREVHLLEPWFNLNRAEQIIGRAVRNCSHALLPKEKRNTTIYFHANTYDEEEESADLRTYRVAESKQKRIIAVEEILKENAIDCNLNKDVLLFSEKKLNIKFNIETSQGKTIKNYPVGDKDNSFICGYKKCQVKCNPELENIKETDNTTYENYFIVDDIEMYKKYISQIYSESINTYTYKMLFETVKSHYNSIDEDIFIIALEEMLEYEYPIYNATVQKHGYLIYRGNKYIFQFLEIKDLRLGLDERNELLKEQSRLKLDLKQIVKQNKKTSPVLEIEEDIIKKFNRQYKEDQHIILEIIIDSLIEDDDIAELKGYIAQKSQEEFTIVDNVLKKYLNIYKKIDGKTITNTPEIIKELNKKLNMYRQEIIDNIIDRFDAEEIIKIYEYALKNKKNEKSIFIKESLKPWIIESTHLFNPNNKTMYYIEDDKVKLSKPTDRTKTIDEIYKTYKLKKLDTKIKGFMQIKGQKIIYKLRKNDKLSGAVCGTSQDVKDLIQLINELDPTIFKKEVTKSKYKKNILCKILEILQRKHEIFDRNKIDIKTKI
jgi:hypothetical protein